MSSVQSHIAQIPFGASHLVGIGTTGKFIPEDTVNTYVVGSGGLQRKDGNVWTYDTYANAVAAFGDSAAPSLALAVGQFFKDTGKFIVVNFLNNNAVSERAIIVTRVRRVLNATTSESDNGAFGYVVTWSANPTGSSGTLASVNVARTSYQSGSW